MIKQRRPNQPEKIILTQVRDLLKIKGWFVVRIQQGMGCHKGVSDLVAMKDGKTVWIEIKTPTGRLSEHQVAFRMNVVASGGSYHVVRSVEDVGLW